MNKAELIEAVQQRLGTECSKAHAERAVNSVLNSIAGGLREDTKVQLVGFGTFQVKDRAARQCRNPRTKEIMTVAASRTVTFRPGDALKESMADSPTGSAPAPTGAQPPAAAEGAAGA